MLKLFLKYFLLISYIFSISQKVRITLTLIYLAIIMILSLMPARDIPDISPFNGFDKLVHLALYFGFAWLLSWSFHTENKILLNYIIFLVCIGWGLLMETFQFYMHYGRSFEWIDMIGNTSGALIGLLVYHLMVRRNFAK